MLGEVSRYGHSKFKVMTQLCFFLLLSLENFVITLSDPPGNQSRSTVDYNGWSDGDSNALVNYGMSKMGVLYTNNWWFTLAAFAVALIKRKWEKTLCFKPYTSHMPEVIMPWTSWVLINFMSHPCHIHVSSDVFSFESHWNSQNTQTAS